MDKQAVMLEAFGIIADSGDASSKFLYALKQSEEENFEEARKAFEEANVSLIDAHNRQTKLLHAEASGEETEYALIMVHAQDHLMNANLLKDLVSSFITLNEKVAKLSK